MSERAKRCFEHCQNVSGSGFDGARMCQKSFFVIRHLALWPSIWGIKNKIIKKIKGGDRMWGARGEMEDEVI